MIELSNGKKELYQYDTNIDALVEDDCDEIHFSNLPFGRSIASIVEDGKARIPNELLINRGDLYCY